MKIQARVILDSVSELGHRLTTMELVYPRLIHSEFVTHRQFSRNAASSRAIPISKTIDMVSKYPALPVRWGANGKGMQDSGEMSPFGQKRAAELWLKGRDEAVAVAKSMAESPEVPHKQIVNRILEPYLWMTTLVSATSWDNFFALRDHSAADPTIAALAAKAREAYDASIPQFRAPGDWHLPFIEDDDITDALKHVIKNQPPGPLTETVVDAYTTEILLAVSTARCARVSYLNHDGKRSTIEDDLTMYKRLVEHRPPHASPAEHQATPDIRINDTELWLRPWYHGNFEGWVQHRKLLAEEAVQQKLYTGPVVYDGEIVPITQAVGASRG